MPTMRRNLFSLVALTAIVAMPGFAQPTPPPATGALMEHSALMLADHTMRSSKLIGAAVYNDQGEKIGTVDDIIVTAGAVEPTVVVSVGAFLGTGEKLVSEPLSHVKLGKGDRMMMPGATKSAISAKPAYKYEYGLQGGGG